MIKPKLKGFKHQTKTKRKSSLSVDANLAQLVRKVASAEGRQLTPLIHDMLLEYIERHHRDWKLEFEDRKPSIAEQEIDTIIDDAMAATTQH